MLNVDTTYSTTVTSEHREREDKKWAVQAAKRAERKQTLTTSIYGLKEDEPSQTPQTTGIVEVSPIQCAICATHKIPALHFCYRCFLEILVNQTFAVVTNEDTVEYKCKICSIKSDSRTEIHIHSHR